MQFPTFLNDFLNTVMTLLNNTDLPRQFREVDSAGLLRNPWFMVPAGVLGGYMLYRKNFRDLIILLLIAGIWYASGTDYMQSLTVNGELQLSKVLPVVFGGAGVLALVIYLLFGRSD